MMMMVTMVMIVVVVVVETVGTVAVVPQTMIVTLDPTVVRIVVEMMQNRFGVVWFPTIVLYMPCNART